MDSITGQLPQYLADYGPWLLFALAFLETCFITGLAVPAGVATSVGTVLALEGSLSLPTVALAAVSGGALGDSVGYWVGRAAGDRILSENGRFGQVVARRHDEVSRFFGRHPVYSVTLARLVSFVRTVMPMAAGMSRVAYPRFLAYEALGVAGWAALYVGIGVLAQESWEEVLRVLGIGGAVAFSILGVLLWMAFTRQVRRRRRGAGSHRAP